MASIRPCRGNTEDWQKVNPILDEGEIGVERKTDGTCVTRIGNGKNRYFDLPILSDSSTFPKLNETAANAEQAAKNAQEAAKNANEVYEKLKDTDVSSIELDVSNLKKDLQQHVDNSDLSLANYTHRLDTMPVKKISFRYLRDYLNGAVGQAGVVNSYWVQGEIFSGGKIISSGLPVSFNFTPISGRGDTTSYTNGNIVHNNMDDIICSPGAGEYYVQLDLGEVRHDIDYIKVYHQVYQDRKYNHKLLVSDDAVTWYTLFDSEQQGGYIETAAGRTHYLNETYIESLFESIADESKIEDTGWVKLQLLNDFATYSTRPLRIRKIEKLVEIRGEIRADPNLGVIAILPAWGIPSVRVCTLQQGGEYNIWMLNVYSYDGSGEPGVSGEITATRYRTGGTASKPPATQEGHWMPIHVTYYVD